MSDVEILGRSKYLPTKLIDRTEQSRTEKRIRDLSEQRRESPIRPIDIVYERLSEDSQQE
jgi:hypothetical protein